MLCLILSGCSKVKLPESEVPFNAEYVRDITFFKGRDDEIVILIDGYEDFLDRFEPHYSLSPDETIYGESTITEEEIKGRYTESWFKDHQLIITWLEQSSLTELKVTKVRPSENGCMFVELDRFNGVYYSEENAHWEVIIEIDRCLEKETEIRLWVRNREEDSRIVMNVLSVSDDDHKAVVSVRNDSDTVINFPPFYRIQKKQAEPDNWNNLPLIDGTSVSTILYSCVPGEEGRYEFYWPYYEYPAEKAGIYRMVIEYSFGDWPGSSETKNNMYYEYELAE